MSGTRKIAAILVADVVGYSRLAGADEDRTLSRLRGLRSDLIDPAIDAHHGRTIKRTGDGILIEFRSVVDAVRCAIEVQSGMVERNAGLPPERRIEFRIGIHLGDVVEEPDGDLMGDGVNIAARLEGICAPGAICLSDDAYRQVKGRLDLKVADLGLTQLKNIAEPVRTHSLQVGLPAPAKREKSARLRAPAAPKNRRALAALVLGIAALAVVAAGGWRLFGSNRPAAARLSIVVLPFANLSGDPAQDYFADALTDGLTTGVARIRDIFVIARNTAFAFKDKPIDARAIGKDLGVRYVLEGSVQPGSSQVRVNAQLIDAENGAHVWAEQFDTPRADLLPMQDEIVTHLARALDVKLAEAEAARLKRTPATNPNAEDLALQCLAAARKSGYSGKEADAGYRLCEQALAADPDNVLALTALSVKFWMPVGMGASADPKADLERADELASRALAVDPNFAGAHLSKAWILLYRGSTGDAIAEAERALVLDPTMVDAYGHLGWSHQTLGQFEKSPEYFDKAIRLSPHDPNLVHWYTGKSRAFLALKQYGQAIEFARQAIAISPNDLPYRHAILIAALALTDHAAEAGEALQRYLALYPSGPKTIAAWKAALEGETDPRVLELNDRTIEGLRKAGMPEA